MSKYDRASLVGVVTAPDGSQYIDILGASYVRLIRSLQFFRYHRVRADEAYNLPKISYREYRMVSAWWVIGAYNGMVNIFYDCPAGALLRIPTMASIDGYIRAVNSANKGARTIVLA